jgi:hypothetical protein
MRFGRYKLIAALVLGGVILAACSHSTGGPRSASGGSSGASEDARSIAAIVQCFRSHGDPGFPDPVYDPGDGRWHFAISPASVPASTRQACQHLFPTATPTPPVSQAVFQKLVSFAQCMRRQGVYDWPDPAPDGSFRLDARLWGLGKRGGVYQAMNACHFPSGGINVVPAS